MISIAKPIIGDEEKKAVLEVLESGVLSSGSFVSKFEKNFSEYIGVKNCTATSNGTTSLEVALRASGIGSGDKVITTPFSFIASTNAIIYTGATPIFADIDKNTYNIDPYSIENILKTHKDIKALLIVHLYGQCCNMDKIIEIVKKHNLLLIEDCAQAHGAQWKGKKAGSFGHVSAFSFYPTKNMTTSEGGMVATNHEEINARARLLINHGMKVRYYHDSIGYNYRMTNISAAIGCVQLEKLDSFNLKREENARFFSSNIKNPDIVIPVVDQNAKHVYHQYTLSIKNGLRDYFVKHLELNNIGYGVYYPLSIPEQKCYNEFNFAINYEVTNVVKNEVISIPVHPALTNKERITIIEAINNFGGKK